MAGDFNGKPLDNDMYGVPRVWNDILFYFFVFVYVCGHKDHTLPFWSMIKKDYY